MAESSTTGDLYKAKAITEEDMRAAVDAYMADPTTSLFVMGDGYGLDLAEAVREACMGLGDDLAAGATEN